jgi:hypothetical protein
MFFPQPNDEEKFQFFKLPFDVQKYTLSLMPVD